MELEKLLQRLVAETEVNLQAYNKEEVCIVVKGHPHYEGYNYINLSDGTEIRKSGKDKFKVSTCYDSFEPFEATADEVIDFYKGIHAAYGLIFKDDSEFYKKGFIPLMLTLIDNAKTK